MEVHMSDIDRESTIENLQSAGLSVYEHDGECWLAAGDSARLIGWLNGCIVDTKYLSNPARRGDVKFRKIGAIRLYSLMDIRKYVVKIRGPQPGFKHSQESKNLISQKNKASWQDRHKEPVL